MAQPPTSDPASLANLADIVLPPPVPWWPPAPGWYAVLALALLAALGLALVLIRRQVANRYRREALAELARMPSAGLAGLPELLKRVALCAWPRARVAALTGRDWWRFLDATSPQGFPESQGQTLARLAYDPDTPLTEQEATTLHATSRNWIHQHHPHKTPPPTEN